jgi:hypothetical protein
MAIDRRARLIPFVALLAATLCATACGPSAAVVELERRYTPVRSCETSDETGEEVRVAGTVACEPRGVEACTHGSDGCDTEEVYALTLVAPDRRYPLAWAYNTRGDRLGGTCARWGRFAGCSFRPRERTFRIECGSQVIATMRPVELRETAPRPGYAEVRAEMESATDEERRTTAQAHAEALRAEARVRDFNRFVGSHVVSDVCLADGE